jgi:hypothetical protein
MGKTHYIYMNGSYGCLPDTLSMSFDIKGCVDMFKMIFGDDLHQGFNLAEAIEEGKIESADVYAALENFFTEDDWEFSDVDEDEFFEKEYALLLEQGYVKRYVNDELMEAIDMFGALYVEACLEEFRDSGHIDLGSAYGADYASGSECNCNEPWEHTDESKEYWLRWNGDEWATEEDVWERFDKFTDAEQLALVMKHGDHNERDAQRVIDEEVMPDSLREYVEDLVLTGK